MLRAVRDEPGGRDDEHGFDVAAAARAHPLIAMGVAAGAGALYVIARRAGRARTGDALGAIVIVALAEAATRMVRRLAVRTVVALWRGSPAQPVG